MRRAWPPSGGRVRASAAGRSREVGAVEARDVGGLAGQWRAGARAVVRGVSVGVRHGPEQLPSGLAPPRGIPWGYAYATTGRVGSRPNLSAGCGLGFVLRGSWPSSISPRRQPLEPPHERSRRSSQPDVQNPPARTTRHSRRSRPGLAAYPLGAPPAPRWRRPRPPHPPGRAATCGPRRRAAVMLARARVGSCQNAISSFAPGRRQTGGVPFLLLTTPDPPAVKRDRRDAHPFARELERQARFEACNHAGLDLRRAFRWPSPARARRARGPGHARPPMAPALALAALHAWGGARRPGERARDLAAFDRARRGAHRDGAPGRPPRLGIAGMGWTCRHSCGGGPAGAGWRTQ